MASPSSGAERLRLLLGEDEPTDDTGPDPSGWLPPLPLGRTTSTPPFPVRALPLWLAEFVEALAVATQTPTCMPGALVLAALATAAGGRAVVEVAPGWREPLNLFTAVAMPPGSRKSAVVARVTAPLVVAERDAIAAAGPLVVEAVTRRKAAEKAAEQAAAIAGRATGADREKALADAVESAHTAEAVVVPTTPRLLADDATPEALASLLAAQGGRVAVLSAEGDVFDIMAGRYSNGPNLGVYLRGHAGDPLRVDRKGRAPEYVAAPALTVGLAVQPDVLRSIADRPGFRGRGLLARFLYAVPPSNIGRRSVGTPPVSAAVGDRYDAELTVLVSTLAEWSDPAVLTLTPDARGVLLEAERALEPRLGPSGDLGHLADWAGKLAGATVRMAGLIHLAGNVRTGWGQPITATTMRAALDLADYCAAHAAAAFDLMGADPLIADARAVAPWLRDRERFTRREAHRAHEARFPKATDLDPVLELLEERGWIRRLTDPPPSPKGGRPPSSVYAVNPLCQPTEPTQPTEPRPAGGSVGSSGSVGT